jgi:hypothetical protein
MSGGGYRSVTILLGVALVGSLGAATTSDAEKSTLGSLPVEQQLMVLESFCTDISNGHVIFTCENEFDYLARTTNNQVLETLFQINDLTDIIIRGGDSAEIQDHMTGDFSPVDLVAAAVESLLSEDASEPAPSLDELSYVDLYPIALELNIDPNSARMSMALKSLAAKYKCGWYVRPNPRRAATWNAQGGYSDPSATLASWGFHRTPGFAGGGWTRAQTFSWPLCGFGTFRDHAFFGRDGNLANSFVINLQDYGDPPYGEPNPEVWRSGPWPYPTWPTYVWWWHRTR